MAGLRPLAAEDIHRMPDGVTAGDAAAMLGTYLTAWFAPAHLARLQHNERVVDPHSTTGGVGMAAIAVAQSIGAQIFATVETSNKYAQLRALGITHVSDSRTAEFGDQIRHDTNGDSVDVVLNSLTWHAQRVSIDLVSIGGRFVEIGKKDIYADSAKHRVLRCGLVVQLKSNDQNLWVPGGRTFPDDDRTGIATLIKTSVGALAGRYARAHGSTERQQLCS